MHYLLARIKGGIAPTLVFGIILFMLSMLVGIPSGLTEPLMERVPFYTDMPSVVRYTVFLVVNLLVIATVLFVVGLAKHRGLLAYLVSWLPQNNVVFLVLRRVFDSKVDVGFRYLVFFKGANGPTFGIATLAYKDMVDRRPKMTVFIATAPSPVTGPAPPRFDMKYVITKEAARKWIKEGRYDCVDEIVYDGWVIVYSDFAERKTPYTLTDFFLNQASYGMYAPPGEETNFSDIFFEE